MNRERYTLTPHMKDYDDFVDRGETQWLPYLMYFHRRSYRSDAVNTDRLGFRLSTDGEGRTVQVADGPSVPAADLVVGSSTAFGVGTSTDAATLASRLAVHHPDRPWLNFGGRGYGTTQEFLLFLLHRGLLPEVRNIVILTGLNDLALGGLPRSVQGEYGGFFFSGEFYSKMGELREEHKRAKAKASSSLLRRTFGSGAAAAPTTPPPPVDDSVPAPEERVEIASERVSENLGNWRIFADALGAKVSFVMQPLATWIRDTPSPEEKRLFDELDSKDSSFWRLFGAIADQRVGKLYADALGGACAANDVSFLDMNAALTREVEPDRWLFVDRAHFNDGGYDLVSRLIASQVDLA